jgi:hypothetical protein
MLQRHDEVGGGRRRRQRRDQRADKRPAALDRNRGDDHDRRGHGHLEGKAVPEQRIREHQRGAGVSRRVDKGALEVRTVLGAATGAVPARRARDDATSAWARFALPALRAPTWTMVNCD